MSKLLKKIGSNSRKALNIKINSKKKNKVLKDFVTLIKNNKNKILNENKKDIKFAKQRNLKENLINRLSLNHKKIRSIINSVKTIISLKDPVNKVTSKWKRPNGLEIRRVTIPLGVIGVKYKKTSVESSRFSISVRKNVGNAPFRSHIKRLLRETIREKRSMLNNSYDFCFFVTNPPKNPLDYSSVLKKVKGFFSSLNKESCD